MHMMDTALQNALHVALALGFPPLLLGVIAKTKALFAGRVGPPVLQPYYDLIKLFRKGSVFSTDDDLGLPRRAGRGTGDRRHGAAAGPAGQYPPDAAAGRSNSMPRSPSPAT